MLRWDVSRRPSLALPYTDNSSKVLAVSPSSLMSLQMLMTTSMGVADALGADVDERTDSQLSAQAPLASGRLRPGVRRCQAPDVTEDLNRRPSNQGIPALRNLVDILQRAGRDDWRPAPRVQ